MVPLPEPTAPDTIDTQLVLVDAVQEHAVTDTVPVPTLSENEALVGPTTGELQDGTEIVK